MTRKPSKTKARFHVGQVVVRKDNGSAFKIERITWQLKGTTGREHWLYHGYITGAWEEILRPLTKREAR